MKGIALFLSLLLFVSTPVLACSSHGSAAAANVNSWLAQNGLGGFNATGGQSNNDGVAGQTNGQATWAWNDVYFVTVQGPGGSSFTFNADPTNNPDTGGAFSGGYELEQWLEQAAQEWILDNVQDAALGDYVG